MLHSYYDINKKDAFEKLFHDTWILNNPTDEKNKYMILTFNFSAVDPDIEEVENSFNEYCNIQIDGFVDKYKNIIDKKIITKTKQFKKSVTKFPIFF